MRRPPAHEWAVLDEDGDPVPGDPDAVALLGTALRETAERIWRQAGEIKALASVESWKSEAADRFRDAAGDAADTLRKAYHRYHAAAQAMGCQVREGNETDWASALEQAQKMADKALKDAQTADADHKTAVAKIAALPKDTDPSDPTLTGLQKQQQSASTALGAAKSALRAAKDVRDNAADSAAQHIHRAITHDGLHDSRWDKVRHSVGDALSDVGHTLEDADETALTDLASIGNAMAHDAGAVMEILGGIGLATLGAGGEAGGIVLDATGIGALLGVPTAAVSATAIAGGLSLAGLGASTIAHDAAGPDRVNMSSDGGSGGGGDWDPSAVASRTGPSNEPDPSATPRGRRTPINDSDAPENKLALQRENETADTLSKSGYDVEQNPSIPGNKNPDYRVEGQVFDNVAPSTGNPRNIAGRISQKVEDGQTDRVVVNLADSSAAVGKLRSQLHDWPIEGLKEVIVIDKQGNVLHLYP